MLLAARNGFVAVTTTPPTPADWGLCFTAEEPNVVVNMTKTGSPPAVTLETSTNGVTWTAFDAAGGTTPIALANIGDKAYFRAGASGNTSFGGLRAYYRFTFSGLCAASGDISSILNADSQVLALTGTYTFRSLFSGCTSLTKASELPATTLAQSCYMSMFNGCTSLTTPPGTLPAANAVGNVYNQMFSGCSSLAKSPKILATTFGSNSCSKMFYNCEQMNELEIWCSEWPSSLLSATADWLYGVAASGTFRCPTALGTEETISRGNNYCPTGWIVVNTD